VKGKGMVVGVPLLLIAPQRVKCGTFRSPGDRTRGVEVKGAVKGEQSLLVPGEQPECLSKVHPCFEGVRRELGRALEQGQCRVILALVTEYRSLCEHCGQRWLLGHVSLPSPAASAGNAGRFTHSSMTSGTRAEPCGGGQRGTWCMPGAGIGRGSPRGTMRQ